MDELMDGRLRAQEQALQSVLALFSVANQRLGSLGGGVGWVGPAATAFDLAVLTLRVEFRAAENHLVAALSDTANALSTKPGQSCG